MNTILVICVLSYAIILVISHIFIEKRLNNLHLSNISKVPAEDNKALTILNSRLKMLIRIMSLLLLIGGIFIFITLL